ncbi:ATP-binding protein [Deinococcus xianganensis]|uniref:histidine kinase n=1 Tax=Deinococcus xianganensis TaxID=1507289 RepID=A0A6I4YTR5_9DEIO|nr:ATP-binding protein [Deinococcus xianganensis]MXV21025.1 PAS domain-containing protein [Deinococcus xianganensis]
MNPLALFPPAWQTVDWYRTPLGAMDQWPSVLRTTLNVISGCTFPMAVIWGREQLLLYNSSFSNLLGAKHPGGLGRPTRDVWPIDAAILRHVWEGETVTLENHPCPLTRRGYPEETYFTLSYSPVRDEPGAVCGMLVTALETTAQVLAVRRADALRRHAEALGNVLTMAALHHLIGTFHPGEDLPFIHLHVAGDASFPAALRGVLTGRHPHVLPWQHGAREGRLAMVVPVEGMRAGEALGVLVMGLNEHVPLDDAYRSFLLQYARQAEAALGRVQSHDHLALHRTLEVERAALASFMDFMEAVDAETDIEFLVRKAVDVLKARYPGATVGYSSGHPAHEATPGGERFAVLSTLGTAHPYSQVSVVIEMPSGAQPDRHLTARLVYGEPEAGGVLTLTLPNHGEWTALDRSVLQAVGRGLKLSLSRAMIVRGLAEEREALMAFMQFTERTADTSDIHTLAMQAAEVMRTTLPVESAVYLERTETCWVARDLTGVTDDRVAHLLEAGLPLTEPTLEQAVSRREATYLEHGTVPAYGAAHPYRTVALYPLFPPEHPVGLLGMGSVDRSAWSARDRAVFQAVGNSFRLALERSAYLEHIKRQRERLADLNVELGHVIAQAALTLDAPAQYLSRLLQEHPSGEPLAGEGLLFDPATLQDEVNRLKGAARDFQVLADLDTHALNRELVPLREVFGAARQQSGAAGVTWSIEALPIVRTDAALLRQAVETLLTFTLSPTRGTQFVSVRSQEMENEVRVIVEDDGVGLSGEEASTLFDLTVRTGQRVPLMEGGGLGQVRRLLARQGGWAWAEARLSGATLVLALPKDEDVHRLEELFQDDELP